MMPTYRRDCDTDALRSAWDAEREQRLIALLALGRMFTHAWYTYIRSGVLP